MLPLNDYCCHSIDKPPLLTMHTCSTCQNW